MSFRIEPSPICNVALPTRECIQTSALGLDDDMRVAGWASNAVGTAIGAAISFGPLFAAFIKRLREGKAIASIVKPVEIFIEKGAKLGSGVEQGMAIEQVVVAAASAEEKASATLTRAGAMARLVCEKERELAAHVPSISKGYVHFHPGEGNWIIRFLPENASRLAFTASASAKQLVQTNVRAYRRQIAQGLTEIGVEGTYPNLGKYKLVLNPADDVLFLDGSNNVATSVRPFLVELVP